MSGKKVLILLPDGIGLRNFAYTDFYKKGLEMGFEMKFWNNTPFDLSSLGFQEVKINNAKPRPFTDLLKRSRTRIDLKLSKRRNSDPVYDSYIFPMAYRDVKSAFKNAIVKVLVAFHSSDAGVAKIRRKIVDSERQSDYYHQCLTTLKTECPDIVLCTNQRPLTAISPIIAAQDLGIPTATFIFSWDNLPKATMVIETDYYFVWSKHMKAELLEYYPYIDPEKIFITGTPQFELHADGSLVQSRSEFFKAHKLDVTKKYICYSGDDITTSPNDPQYLSDVADAVRSINEKGGNLGLIFRRCPVDFSTRYDHVLSKNEDIIVPIAPKWKKVGEGWNTILPTQHDMILQINTIFHTEMVVNLGSSMVFDYAAFDKPCAFINYDVPNSKHQNWSVDKIYKYVHFRSMPSKNSVVWLNNPAEIASKLVLALQNPRESITEAKRWFEIINQHPIEQASTRILNSVSEIINLQPAGKL